MAPKVEGSWNLHLHSQQDPLDFFVLFSSAASLLGSPGQGNYSAANAFQDALAFYRRIRGLPAQTINWGAWTVGQAVAATNRAERIEKHGVSTMSPEQGTEILRRLLRDDTPQVMAIAFDVEQWCQHFPEAAKSPLLADVREATSAGRGGGGMLRAKIAASSAEERFGIVQDYLGETLMRVLQLEGTIDPDQSLNRMGLDSLMAMELRNRVHADLQATVPIVKLLKGVTIAQLARLLLDLVEEDLEESAAGDEAAIDPLLDEIESLSDEEAERLLAEETEGETSESNG
jgi:aryl carrier-like protein